VTSPPALSLAESVALTPRAEGVLQANVAEGWDVRGIPHGGYLLALVTAAMGTVVAHPHPLAVAASYLAPPAFGPAELQVELVRQGKRQSTASVRMLQNGLERVRATATFGELPATYPEFPAGPTDQPEVAAPEACYTADALAMAEGGEPINLHDNLELRLAPDTGWVSGEPSGVGELVGWLRLADGAPPDPLALLMFSDGMPPSIFEARGRSGGHVPTMQLTTHLFGLADPGWVLGRFHTRIVNGSLVGEDGDLWDSSGKLVATTRQLALWRGPTS
jgi:acyl-CoA thioesterase